MFFDRHFSFSLMSIANIFIAPHETRFIPVQLCELAISKHFIKPLSLYIHLKFSCSGTTKLSNDDLNRISTDLQCCSKTVRNNLKKLLTEGWITYSAKTKTWFIKSFQRVMKLYNFTAKSKCGFDFSNITKSKAFIAAIKIGNIVNSKIRKQRYTERNLRKRSTTVSSIPVSNAGLATLLKVSKSHAYHLKKAANDAGFISVKQQFTNTGIDAMYRSTFKMGMPELEKLVRIIDGKICIMKSDLVSHFVRFKNKRSFFKRLVK